MTLDIDMLIDIMTTELQYLASNWSMPGRPILVLPLHRGMLSEYLSVTVFCGLFD